MDMENNDNHIIYLTSSQTDQKWGLTICTAGYQKIAPHTSYPIKDQHPDAYSFSPERGRILNEYQLIYISEGYGYFESSSQQRIKITPGTAIMLFPGEWHTYAPDDNGWFEYWVGFKGKIIERLLDNGFFSKEKPVFRIGVSQTIISLYESVVSAAIDERPCFQQLLSGILMHILGVIFFKQKNVSIKPSASLDKIDEAKALMKANIESPLPVEEIARSLNVSYSWFRSKFKDYTGSSPIQYYNHLRYLRAKELLTISDIGISDIAYSLNFQNVSQFSTFFSKKEGLSPSEYRKKLMIP
jgi:AraC-like DNA-binding protein